MNTKCIGSNDSPILKANDDALGFQVYVDALSEFIVNCETPMTVAVQGDWGSGKTSLMNLIRARVDESPATRAKCIWINTWQFAQFQMGDDLALNVIELFARYMAADEGLASSVLRSIRAISVARIARTALAGAALLSTAVVAGRDSAEAIAQTVSGGGQGVNPTDRLMTMKAELAKLIENARIAGSVERYVVFVDDLDRLVPEKAVELLEAMKVFLDLEGCVFVLACDYHVVSRGLRAKFGADNTDLKGKHFFDKIIQLPFSMPTGQLEISHYLRARLRACGIFLPEDDGFHVSLFERLLAHSVGFNPRGLKRLTNCLQVLRRVAESKQVLEGTEREGSKSERERALFAALCLQTAYEPLYVALMEVTSWRGVDLGHVIAHLMAPASSEDAGPPVRVRERLSAATQQCEALRPGAGQEIPLFLEALNRAIQIRSSATVNVDPEEAAMFVSMLRFSSITATSLAVQEGTRRADLSSAEPVILAVQKSLQNEHGRRTRWSDGVDGIWTAPVLAGLGFDVYFGVSRDGALCLSVDIATGDKGKIPRARDNARRWCGTFLTGLDPSVPCTFKQTNAIHSVVYAVLEPEGFVTLPSAEMRARAFAHVDRVLVPLMKDLQSRMDR